MAVTIQEVARRAGVSTATVSHVLNDSWPVSLRTRQRVFRAVKTLGYFPNAHARNLAARTNRTLGIIVSDIENPFFPEVIKGFEKRARHHGYEVLVSDTDYNPRLTRRAAERMVEQKVSGVAIMTSEMSCRLINLIVGQQIPVTLFDSGSAREHVSNVRMDYRSGIRQVVEHVYALGHHRIAFAGGESKFKNILARENGYVESMRALSLPPLPTLPGNQRFEGGMKAGEALLCLPERPTAVVCVNDLTAVGLIKVLHQNGLNVPGDISVTGFDRTRLASQLHPSLTTIDMHTHALGQLAADALIELLSSPKARGREHLVSLDLVVGESTGPPPKRL